MRHAIRRMTLLSVALAMGCGPSEQAEEVVGARVGALSPTNARILGFETPQADWSVVNGGLGTITSSPIHSQGSFSLAINARGFVPIRSVAMSSLGADVFPTIHYDIMLPPQQPNPFWFGTTQLYVDIPSRGINSAFIGQVELTGFPLSQFKEVDYTLPANVLAALRGTYTDLRFTVVINVPSNATGTYRVDNFQVAPAVVTPTITQISSDTFTNSTSQHATQVEPDSFAFGTTIVAAVQTGRFVNAGASDLAFATSKDSGATWVTGNLPGVTTFSGGTLAAVSDPSVAFDSKHNVWLIVGLGITDEAAGRSPFITASRSTDGGLTWQNPVIAATGIGSQDFDKTWVVCDNTSTSPFFGNCYAEFDDDAGGDAIQMITSTDGGLTWSVQKTTADNASGLGGQPLVQPNGTVIVPALGASIIAFQSTDGGGSWSASTTVSPVSFLSRAGFRSEALPSAEIDHNGTVYVAWADCRFRTGCTANDIVFSSSSNGTTWSAVTRVPIDATTSGIDHVIPGLGVDPTTADGTAHLGLTYYFLPDTTCSGDACQLSVGFISSVNGGATWGTPTTLAGPMTLSWLANSGLGRMVGDYVSTSFVGGAAHSVFVVASAPTGTVFNEALFTASNSVM